MNIFKRGHYEPPLKNSNIGGFKKGFRVIHVRSIQTSMPIKVVLGGKSMVLKVVSSGSEASYAPKFMKIRKRMVFCYLPCTCSVQRTFEKLKTLEVSSKNAQESP